MSQFTEWFPGHISPVREGVYQTSDATYAYFDSDTGWWTRDADSPAEAMTEMLFGLSRITSVYQWRGLACPAEPDLFE